MARHLDYSDHLDDCYRNEGDSMNTTDWRELCRELVDAQDAHDATGRGMTEVLTRARAALAEPVGEGSSDEYLNRVYQGAYQPTWERGEFHGAHYDGLRAVAAAVAADLLEQRHPAPVPPVEGEVGELVAWLRDRAESTSLAHNALRITRAADPLERLASPACLALKPSPELTEAFKDLPPGRIELLPEDAQVIEPTNRTILVPAPMPVAVSERLPGPEDCDGEGRCWWLLLEHECDAMWCESPTVTHWLPATALPLPQGEVEK